MVIACTHTRKTKTKYDVGVQQLTEISQWVFHLLQILSADQVVCVCVCVYVHACAHACVHACETEREKAQAISVSKCPGSTLYQLATVWFSQVPISRFYRSGFVIN